MDSKRKRRAITLLEIMIVILVIGMIGGVLSYNLKGSLDRGKKLKSEIGMKRLQEILELEIDRGNISVKTLVEAKSADNAVVKNCVVNSELIPPHDIDTFLKDGWNNPYIIEQDQNGNIQVNSPGLAHYRQSHP